MLNHFCTITTQSHLYKTKALIQSVKSYTEAHFHVLVVDGLPPTDNDAHYADLSFFKSELALSIIAKYKHKTDKLRWALKPVFMAALLQEECDKLVYIDNDIYFFSSPQFIFDLLDQHDILITPHHYSFDSSVNQILFEANLWCGLYNAGFVASSSKGIPALTWWSNCCLYNVKKAAWRGLFDDQKYLDLLPVVFNNIHVLKHKGCNIAGWNLENNVRQADPNNRVFIAPDFPIVFIHFTPAFFQNIFYGRDLLLKPHHDAYVSHLEKLKPSFTVKSQFKKRLIDYLFFARYCVWRIVRLKEKYLNG